MRSVDTDSEEEGFVVFYLQLFDGPIHTFGVGHFLFLLIGQGSPFEEESTSNFLALVVDAVGEGFGIGCAFAPGVQGPTTFALALVAEKELGPTPLINGSGWVVKEFACSEGLVSCLGEADLQWFNLRVIHEVIGGGVATGGRSELPTEDGRSTGSTEDASSVSIGEVDSSGCEFVEVWGDGPGSGFVATDPVIHVIHGEEDDVGLCGLTGCRESAE